MALCNRDKDASEQKAEYQFIGSTQINTGATAWVAMVPFACTVQSARAGAAGLSGAMQVAFQALRFAAGGTLISLGISNLVVCEFGTSGIQGYSGLAAAGSTLLNLQAGDILSIQTSVANTAVRNLLVEIVVKKTQDIVSHNGVST